MGRKFPLFVIMCLGLLAHGQNLVSNGNFEIYSSCPTGTSSQSNMQINLATGWTQSSLTPDYFNACNAANVNVPNSYHGHQKDCCGGNGYAGGYMFFDDTTNGGREYITQYLQDTLKPNRKYLASMYVSRADFNYSIATAAMLFTDTSTYLNWPNGFIQTNPQVWNSVLLDDTVNWILIQDTFRVNNNKRVLTIGNFNTNATSDTVMSPGGFGTWGYFGAAYYYIDGVSVFDITGGACNSYWDAGPDKFIFKGDSIRLGAINTDNSTYTWINSIGGNTFLTSNGDARPWTSATTTTTYYVTKTCPDNTQFNDTITVYVTDTSSANVSQINNDKTEVIIYPNPNAGTFLIYYKFTLDSKLEVIDISGKLVGKYNLSASANSLNITNDKLENGVYFYHLSDGTTNHTGKIVIMK